MNPKSTKQISNGSLAVLLLLSGACALIYQSVWLREFRLVFGATTSATGAVLAIFMGGLGVGNLWFAKRVDRWQNPLRAYALLEFGILLSAALSPWLIDLIRQANILLGGQTEMGYFVATLFRLATSTAVLMAPTFLMGGTLPCCAALITDESDVHRRGVGLIYGCNTLGAMIGVLVANFYLLEAMGNRGLLWSSCSLNILLAIVALGLSAKRSPFQRSEPHLSHHNDKSHTPERIDTPDDRRWVNLDLIGSVTFAGGIGFVFFVMELVWYRMLGPLLGGTTYTFALILASVLAGIGVGGALYGALAPYLGKPRFWLSATCAAEALTLGIPFWLGDTLALWVLRQSLDTPVDFLSQVFRWIFVTAVVVFPTSLVAGFQFPLLIASAGSGRNAIGRDVGWLFSANTVGAIAGSLCGGFWMLPLFTAPGTWQFCIMLLACAALGWLAFDRSLPHKRLSVNLPAFTIATFAFLALLTIASRGPTAFWRHSGIGAKRTALFGDSPNSIQALLNRQRRIPILETEGIESSIAITAIDSLTFVVNGKSDGNAFGDCRTQIGSTLLGTLIHTAPKTGLVIGLGTGESAGWLASVDFMERVDVVELEPKITRMAELCSSMNEDVLSNPKVNLTFNDAREALLTSNNTYDLIFSEPSNPYRAGVANLYTTEFYQSIRKRLNPDGLFLQWLQGYEVDATTMHIALHTLRHTFPTIQVWITQSRDILFVCGEANAFTGFTEKQIDDRLQVPAISRGLRNSWRVIDSAGVLAHYVCSTPTIDNILKQSPARLNTDGQNFLEFAFAKSLGTFTEFSIDNLRRKASDLADHVPFAVSPVLAAKIRRRTLASYVIPGGYVPAIPEMTDDEQRLSDAMNYYLGENYEEAAKRFEMLDIDIDCPIERVVAAHTFAVTQREIPQQWLELIDAFRPCEALAIQSTVSCRKESWDACLETLRAFFVEMQVDPWGYSQVLRQAYANALEVSKRAPEFAAQISTMLSPRWAVFRDEEMRQFVRYRVALHDTEQELLKVIEAYEPHPIWSQEFLEKRAQLYQQYDHALSEDALKDVAKYRIQYVIGDF